jgi:hypothetical protein
MPCIFTIAWLARHVWRLGAAHRAGGCSRSSTTFASGTGCRRSHLGERTCGTDFIADCTVEALIGTHQLFSNQVEACGPLIGALRGTPDYEPLPLLGVRVQRYGRGRGRRFLARASAVVRLRRSPRRDACTNLITLDYRSRLRRGF